MISMPRILLIGACVGALAITTPASAQQPPNDSNVSFDAGGLLPKKTKPSALPDVKAQPLAWPRLDPGAVLCRTEADLAKLGARRSGESVEGPIDCQIIRAATPVSIVQRKGPGQVEVTITGSKTDAVTGWTNAWLPEKGAVGATSVMR
jgi:hypothetical protein